MPASAGIFVFVGTNVIHQCWRHHLDGDAMTALRWIVRGIIGLLVLVIGLIGLALLGTIVPFPFVASTAPASGPVIRIYVASNPIHTDIAIPVESRSIARFAELAASGLPITHPEAEWLLVGWGGRSFYMETPSFNDIKPGPTFRALTLDAAVMHVDVLGPIDTSNPDLLPIDLDVQSYRALLEAMSQSFTRKDGQIIPIPGYRLGPNDRFYEGEGWFNALLGCNTWTARMLRAAGLTTGLWNPLPQSLTLSLRLFNRLPPH